MLLDNSLHLKLTQAPSLCCSTDAGAFVDNGQTKTPKSDTHI